MIDQLYYYHHLDHHITLNCLMIAPGEFQHMMKIITHTHRLIIDSAQAVRPRGHTRTLGRSTTKFLQRKLQHLNIRLRHFHLNSRAIYLPFFF